jgi:rod shape-determining protein MreC
MRAGWRYHAPSNAVRLLFALLFSATLMVVDHRSHYLQTIRATLSVVIYPVQVIAQVPSVIGNGMVRFFAGEAAMREENERLRHNEVLLKARLQKYHALEVENERLRKLLGAAGKVAERAVIAELLEVSLEPFTQRIIVDKGSREGLYLGQPVIDAQGIMGQITQITPLTSTATLITDPSHAIPVQNQRNGLRAILFGTGSQHRLEVPHLTAISDIKVGDVLVSSGMGRRFPSGYPVARVTNIISDPNEPFLRIDAEPVARLDHSKEVLLIWPGTSRQVNPGGGT